MEIVVSSVSPDLAHTSGIVPSARVTLSSSSSSVS